MTGAKGGWRRRSSGSGAGSGQSRAGGPSAAGSAASARDCGGKTIPRARASAGPGSRRRAAGEGEKRAWSGQGRAGLPPDAPEAAAGAGPNRRGCPPMRGGSVARGPAAGALGRDRPFDVLQEAAAWRAGPRPGRRGRAEPAGLGRRRTPAARPRPARDCPPFQRRGPDVPERPRHARGRREGQGEGAGAGRRSPGKAGGEKRRGGAGPARAPAASGGRPADGSPGRPAPRRSAPRAGRADRGRPRGREVRAGPVRARNPAPGGIGRPRTVRRLLAASAAVHVYGGPAASLSALDILLSNVASLVTPLFFST